MTNDTTDGRVERLAGALKGALHASKGDAEHLREALAESRDYNRSLLRRLRVGGSGGGSRLDSPAADGDSRTTDTSTTINAASGSPRLKSVPVRRRMQPKSPTESTDDSDAVHAPGGALSRMADVLCELDVSLTNRLGSLVDLKQDLLALQHNAGDRQHTVTRSADLGDSSPRKRRTVSRGHHLDDSDDGGDDDDGHMDGGDEGGKAGTSQRQRRLQLERKRLLQEEKDGGDSDEERGRTTAVAATQVAVRVDECVQAAQALELQLVAVREKRSAVRLRQQHR